MTSTELEWMEELTAVMQKIHTCTDPHTLEIDKMWADYCVHRIQMEQFLSSLHDASHQTTAEEICATWDRKLTHDDTMTLHSRIVKVSKEAHISIQNSISHRGYAYVLHTATSTAIIDSNGESSCSCKDHQYRKTHCKHLYVLSLSIINPTF